MSQGSQSSTTQGLSNVEQSFEEDKNSPIQQSNLIYDGGKAAWLTVAGTYVVEIFSLKKYCLLTYYSWMIQFCTYGYIYVFLLL